MHQGMNMTLSKVVEILVIISSVVSAMYFVLTLRLVPIERSLANIENSVCSMNIQQTKQDIDISQNKLWVEILHGRIAKIEEKFALNKHTKRESKQFYSPLMKLVGLE